MTAIIHNIVAYSPEGISMQIRLPEFPPFAVVLFLWLISAPLHATLDIEIFGGGATQIPIAIVRFAAEEKLNQSITQVVAADLQRSGLLRIIEPGGLAPHEPIGVVYAEWITRGAGALVIGTTTLLPGGQVALRVRLLDVAKQVQLAAYTETVPTGQLRAAAHRIADII